MKQRQIRPNRTRTVKDWAMTKRMSKRMRVYHTTRVGAFIQKLVNKHVLYSLVVLLEVSSFIYVLSNFSTFHPGL